MEIPLCEEWYTREPLRIRRRKVTISPERSPSEQSELRADRTTWWTVTWVSTGPWIRCSKCTIGSRQKTMFRNGTAVRHLCSQSRPPNQESEPYAPVQCRGPVRQASNRCSSSLPTVRSKQPIPPDHYALFYEVAGSLGHSESGGFYSSGSAVTNFFCRSEYRGSCVLTKVITSNPVWFRRFWNAWEWTRRTQHPSTRSPTAWCNYTLNGRGVSAKGRRIGPQGLGCEITRLPSSLHGIHHDRTGLTPANLEFGRDLRLPCHLVFGTILNMERTQLITRQI
jgi:hypothetical protein